MFLIEYAEGHFINGDRITSLHINAKRGVAFYAGENNESEFQVEEGYEGTFLNNLQAINRNISDIEASYLKQKEKVA
ncbi:MAG: hypothetical protein CMP19_05050 [Rickettsiales bacterium]|nr:hypothetical protein [Rickettsiales bacterium]|tara:strand:- start:29 stop:259 length:231 start_codon:yes stop_codon:yes gene_type:complete